MVFSILVEDQKTQIIYQDLERYNNIKAENLKYPRKVMDYKAPKQEI